MRTCLNPTCPDRLVGIRGEYVDSVEVCPKCGTPLTPPEEENLERHPSAHPRFVWAVIVAYAVSMGLPAVIDTSPNPYFERVQLWGFQAAIVSIWCLVIPWIGPITAPSNPLLIGSLVTLERRRYGWSTLLGWLAVASMLGCAWLLPERAGGGPFRWPGGKVTVGYWLWLACGGVTAVFALVQWRREKGRRGT